MCTRSRMRCSRPTRWADAQAPQVHPSASQSMLNACTTSGVTQSSSVHSDRCQRVVNDGAMAVLEARPALAAVTAHGPFIAPAGADNPRMRSRVGLARAQRCVSAPAEFVQPVVVDAEVVGDLVDHGDRDLVDDLVLGLADVEQRLAVDGDGVGQRARRTTSRVRSARRPRTGPSRSGSSGLRSSTSTTTLSIAAASSGGIRSSASETSSSNRCGLIRTATRLLPWRWRQGLGGRPWPGGGPGAGLGGGGARSRASGRRPDPAAVRHRRAAVARPAAPRRRRWPVEERVARRLAAPPSRSPAVWLVLAVDCCPAGAGSAGCWSDLASWSYCEDVLPA